MGYIQDYVIRKRKEIKEILKQTRENIERKKLIAACKIAMENPHFQRDYLYKGNTYCNQGSEWILKKLGYDTKFFYSWWKARKKYIVTTANQIFDKCIQAEKEGILKVIDKKTAQELAWKGIPSLIIAKSKDPKKWGHVTVTYPSPPGEIFLNCNIGWENLICSPDDPRSFAGGKSYLTDYIIYQVPKVKTLTSQS
jgi:hypothetical protein